MATDKALSLAPVGQKIAAANSEAEIISILNENGVVDDICSLISSSQSISPISASLGISESDLMAFVKRTPEGQYKVLSAKMFVGAFDSIETINSSSHKDYLEQEEAAALKHQLSVVKLSASMIIDISGIGKDKKQSNNVVVNTQVVVADNNAQQIPKELKDALDA